MFTLPFGTFTPDGVKIPAVSLTRNMALLPESRSNNGSLLGISTRE